MCPILSYQNIATLTYYKFKYMCKYKVQEKAKLNLLDIINILDLFLKSAKEVLIMDKMMLLAR